MIIVKEKQEAEQVIDYLKSMFDAMQTNFGREFNLITLKNTFVLALEEIKDCNLDISTIRLDDLPLYKLPQIKEITVSKEIVDKVKSIWEIANDISFQKSKDFFDNYPYIRNGQKVGPCGFSHVVTCVANSEITQAFLDLEIAKIYGDGYYYLYGLKTYKSQLLDVEEAGAKAAAEYLTNELNQNFYYHSKLD